MIIMDGNNSQKRSMFAQSDRRRFDSDYFLSDDDANVFRRVVKVSVEKKKPVGPSPETAVTIADEVCFSLFAQYKPPF
jgi:hypothetical protein